MRPFDINYDDFDDFDDFDEFGYGGIETIRKAAKTKRLLEQRLEGRKRRGHARKNPWDDEYWDEYDGYYEDDFDQFSGMSSGHL